MTEASTNTQPGRPTSGGGTHWLIWAGLFLLFAYVLSPGPVYKLYGKSDPPRAVGALWAPLGYLRAHVPPVQAFYDWYLGDLWRINFYPGVK